MAPPPLVRFCEPFQIKVYYIKSVFLKVEYCTGHKPVPADNAWIKERNIRILLIIQNDL